MKPRASSNTRGRGIARGSGRSNHHGRASSGEDTRIVTTTTTIGLVAELPVLSWTGKQSNYADFKEKLSTYLHSSLETTEVL